MESFIINKNNPRESTWTSEKINKNLEDGQILFKIRNFSFTANNVSYITTGDKLGYWQFFPAQKEDFGKVPVWGFAEVEASKHQDIKVGENFYGYFPPSSHLIVSAGEVKKYGFNDISTHRKHLPAVYNSYINTQFDNFYTPETEHFQAIFRPLFITSFLIDVFLRENNFFEAKNIILTSASSKTAYALAFLLKENKKNNINSPTIIGLTSDNNLRFTEKLNCYDEVFTYSTIKNLPLSTTCVVDFAGNQNIHFDLQAHLESLLSYNCLVGAVHWEHTQNTKPLQNKGKFFFAPVYVQKYIQEWGQATFQNKIAESWQLFIKSAIPFINIVASKDKDELLNVYQAILDGKYPAENAFVFEW